MAIVRERIVQEETDRELFVAGDTVRLIDSPLDRLKKGAKGKVVEILGDLATDPHVLVKVKFRVNKSDLVLCSGASRFRKTKNVKEEELPDAEAAPGLDEAEGE